MFNQVELKFLHKEIYSLGLFQSLSIFSKNCVVLSLNINIYHRIFISIHLFIYSYQYKLIYCYKRFYVLGVQDYHTVVTTREPVSPNSTDFQRILSFQHFHTWQP